MDQILGEIFLYLSSFDLSEVSNFAIVAISLIFCQILFACLFLPCSQFSIISGILFGPILGTLVNIVSTSLSFISTYLIGQRFKQNIKSKRVIRLQNLVLDNGVINISSSWQSLLFFYANPIFPGSSMGYFFGIKNSNLNVLIPRSIILITIPCLAYATMGSEFLNSLVKGNYFYGFLVLCLFFILIRYAYPFLLTKLNTKK